MESLDPGDVVDQSIKGCKKSLSTKKWNCMYKKAVYHNGKFYWLNGQEM